MCALEVLLFVITAMLLLWRVMQRSNRPTSRCRCLKAWCYARALIHPLQWSYRFAPRAGRESHPSRFLLASFCHLQTRSFEKLLASKLSCAPRLFAWCRPGSIFTSSEQLHTAHRRPSFDVVCSSLQHLSLHSLRHGNETWFCFLRGTTHSHHMILRGNKNGNGTKERR